MLECIKPKLAEIQNARVFSTVGDLEDNVRQILEGPELRVTIDSAQGMNPTQVGLKVM